jgi:hypothetical protein
MLYLCGGETAKEPAEAVGQHAQKRCIYSLERIHQVTLTKKITSMNDIANIQELIIIQKYIMLININ